MKRKLCGLLLAGIFCMMNGCWTLAADQTLVGISGSEAGVPGAGVENRLSAEEDGTTDAAAPKQDGKMEETIRARVDRMSREEKVGQMLLVSPSQLCDGGDWAANMDTVIQNMKNYYVGGLVFFADDLEDSNAVKILVDRVKEQEEIPVLTVSDAGGSLETGFTKPDENTNMKIGPLSLGTDGIWCYSTQQTPSEEWQEEGILLDVTPGMSPETGAGFAIVTHAKVKYSADAEMTGLENTAQDDGRPASMARSLVTEFLKEETGFDGVVMTDSLSMPEATQNYGEDMAVMNALQAGADILTAPSNVLTAYYGIHSAIDEQLVTEEQINESVTRILEAKAKLGLNF